MKIIREQTKLFERLLDEIKAAHPLKSSQRVLRTPGQERTRNSSRICKAIGLMLGEHIPGHQGDFSSEGCDSFVSLNAFGYDLKSGLPIIGIANRNQSSTQLLALLFGDFTGAQDATGDPKRAHLAQHCQSTSLDWKNLRCYPRPQEWSS
jgi:hypothetical protein